MAALDMVIPVAFRALNIPAFAGEPNVQELRAPARLHAPEVRK